MCIASVLRSQMATVLNVLVNGDVLDLTGLEEDAIVILEGTPKLSFLANGFIVNSTLYYFREM